jgi:thiamine biosynthesis protein ThiI
VDVTGNVPRGLSPVLTSIADTHPVPGTVIVVHYNELALKGGNRSWFEQRLRDDLAGRLAGLGSAKVRRERGRLVIAMEDASPADLDAALDRVGHTPGVAWFAAAQEIPRELAAIESEVLSRAKAGGRGSFRVDTKRSDKTFPLNSVEVNRQVGAAVVVATGRKVDLEEAEEVYGIEIAAKGAFVFESRRQGPGGLPVGTAGKVVALLSGGLDSPVAAWRMMKRGCRVLGVHFLNGAAGEGVAEKLDLLGEALARWQGRFTLRIVPFEALQRAIVAAVPSDHRMLIYRRTMLRLADRIREREGAKALVLGDSVGQVASQTLDNLACVYAAVRGPILAPLAGSDKTETIADARRIGTYEPSILPHPDCCSFLVDAHPATRAKLHDVEAMEKSVTWGTLLEEAIQGTEVRVFPKGEK